MDSIEVKEGVSNDEWEQFKDFFENTSTQESKSLKLEERVGGENLHSEGLANVEMSKMVTVNQFEAEVDYLKSLGSERTEAEEYYVHAAMNGEINPFDENKPSIEDLYNKEVIQPQLEADMIYPDELRKALMEKANEEPEMISFSGISLNSNDVSEIKMDLSSFSEDKMEVFQEVSAQSAPDEEPTETESAGLR